MLLAIGFFALIPVVQAEILEDMGVRVEKKGGEIIVTYKNVTEISLPGKKSRLIEPGEVLFAHGGPLGMSAPYTYRGGERTIPFIFPALTSVNGEDIPVIFNASLEGKKDNWLLYRYESDFLTFEMPDGTNFIACILDAKTGEPKPAVTAMHALGMKTAAEAHPEVYQAAKASGSGAWTLKEMLKGKK